MLWLPDITGVCVCVCGCHAASCFDLFLFFFWFPLRIKQKPLSHLSWWHRRVVFGPNFCLHPVSTLIMKRALITAGFQDPSGRIWGPTISHSFLLQMYSNYNEQEKKKRMVAMVKWIDIAVHLSPHIKSTLTSCLHYVAVTLWDQLYKDTRRSDGRSSDYNQQQTSLFVILSSVFMTLPSVVLETEWVTSYEELLWEFVFVVCI